MLQKEEIIKKIELEKRGYRAFVWAFVPTVIISFLVTTETIKLPWQISNYFYALLLVSAGLVPLVYFVVTFLKQKKEERNPFETIVLGTAFTILLIFFGILFVKLLSSVFVGITYGLWTTVGLTSFFAGTLAYYLNFQTSNINSRNISALILFAMVGGVSASAIFNTNQQWWMESVSYLGMNNQNANLFMNIGLLMAAALLILLSRFVFIEFDRLYKNKLVSERKLNLTKFVYVYSSLMLGLIGAFSFGRSPLSTFVHNFAAYTMFPALILSMLYMPWYIKGLMKGFKAISVFGGVLTIFIYVMFMAKYTSLAIMEVSAIFIIIIWTYLFLKNIILLNILKENNLT